MKKYIILPIILLLTLSACEDYKERYYFAENRIEFDDAVVNPGANPILPEDVNGDAGGTVRFQVNMTGEQKPYDRIVNFEIQGTTTAREGIEYNLKHGTSFVIPANSSFGYIEVEILPGGSGRRVLAFELLPTEDIKVMQRYHRIGIRILYQSAPPNEDFIDYINDITYFRQLTVAAQSSQELGGYMDLITGNVYTRLGAADAQENIDLVYLRGSGSGLNMISPSDNGFSGWGTESAVLNEWTVRNHGTVVRWAEPTQDEIDRFENASSVADLMDNFFYAQATVRDRDGYSTNHGPNFRIRDGEEEDIFLFYSADRKVVAMIKVLDWENTTTGQANFAIKSGQIPDDMVKKPMTFGPQSSTVTPSMGDLLSGRVYFRDPCTNSGCVPKALDYHHNIDLIAAHSSSAMMTFYTPSALGTTFGNYSYLSDPAHAYRWSTINDGEIVRVPNATSAEIDRFENAQTLADLQAIFDDAVAQAPSRDYSNANPDSPSPTTYDDTYYGPHTRVRGMYPGDAVQLIAYRSTGPTGRQVVSVLKVTSVWVSAGNTPPPSNSTGRITAEVKTAEF